MTFPNTLHVDDQGEYKQIQVASSFLPTLYNLRAYSDIYIAEQDSLQNYMHAKAAVHW